MSDFQLAVCSEMVFTDLPIIDRVRRIDDMGFAVEIWSWHDKDLAALAATGARFSSMTGYLHGDLIDRETADEVVRTAELSIKAAETLGVSRLDLHTAELVDGKAARPRYRASGDMWLTALRTLEQIGELGAAAGVTFCVENLNTIVDHPGVPLARAKDTLALVEAVGHPNVRMMLDLYHAQIGEGNLIELIRWRGAPSRSHTRGADGRRAGGRSSAGRAPTPTARARTRRRRACSREAGGDGELGERRRRTPCRSAARRTPPTIASSSERRPATTSLAAEVVVSSAISSMIAHWAAGSQRDAVRLGDRARLDERFLEPRPPLGIVRSSPTGRPETDVTAASGAIRASLCQSTRFSFCPTLTSTRARRSMSAACSTSLAGRTRTRS